MAEVIGQLTWHWRDSYAMLGPISKRGSGMSKWAKLARNPWRYLPLLPRLALQPLCQVFKFSSFFLQGQMDISSRSRWHNQDFARATGGFSPPGERRRVCNLEAHDNTRRDMLALLLRTLVTRGVPGAFAEIGVYRGSTARLIHHYAPERTLHLFDTFEGFTKAGAASESQDTGAAVRAAEFANTSLERVKATIGAGDTVHYHVGLFPASIPQSLFKAQFAFAHLDADLYAPIRAGLDFFWPRMSPGGMALVHDYNSWPGARKAVDDFCAESGEIAIPMPDKSGSALIVKRL